MSKVKDLIETAARHTHDRTDVMIRVRNLRAQKILPADGRKHTPPQIETVHVVSLMLALLKAGPQVEAAQAVRDLWTLPGYYVAHTSGNINFDAGVLTFGQCLAFYVELLASEDPAQRASADFTHFSASRNFEVAQIVYPDGRTHYFQRGGYRPALEGIMSTATSADLETVRDFADLVRHSRAEAKRLGVTIAVEDAYRALGLLPPGGPGSPMRLSPGPSGLPVNMPGIATPESVYTTPETTTTEELAGSSVVAGQTAFPQPCPRDCWHGIVRQTDTQDVCASERSDLFESGEVPASACAGDPAGEVSKKGSSDDRSDCSYPALRAAA